MRKAPINCFEARKDFVVHVYRITKRIAVLLSPSLPYLSDVHPLPSPLPPPLPSSPLPSPQFLLAMMALVVLTLHCFTKPYKERYINIVEALILLDLLLVTGLLIDPESQVPVEFDFFMILLPFVYFVLYLLWRIFQFF